MALQTVEIPSIPFGFYYPEILENLIAFKRQYAPELTDESEREPSIQLLRAYAAVVHQSNCVGDMIAQESMLGSARLTESVREHLRLIGYNLSPARPSKAELVCRLNRSFVSPAVIVPAGALFSTERDPSVDVTLYFEADSQVSVTPTQTFTSVLASEAGAFADFTAQANSPTTPADDFEPWATPESGDAIYFGHDSVMWDRIDTFCTTDSTDEGFGVWEYYSGDFAKASPDSVEQIGGKLRFIVDGYLGAVNRNGTTIRVQVNRTTASEDVVVTWTGEHNVAETSSLLAQSVVSLDPADYTIGSDWESLPGLSSSSGLADLYFGIDGDQVTWTLPQSQEHNWRKVEIEGVEAYWIRFRWIEAPVSGPVVQYATIDDGKQYVIANVTQGRTTTDSPLGSSTGAINQRFTASKANFIDGTDELLVDGIPWLRVENFILSGPQDEHYRVELTGEDDRPVAIFSDGVRGKVPPAGVANIVWTYRYGAQDDGNVGANTITLDRAGLANVGKVYNPRQAAGWSAAEGSSDESLAAVKEYGPASIRIPSVALGTSDLVDLTKRYVDDSGAKPFSRAFAIEEGYGPGTVELVVVHRGGDPASGDELDDLALFFNGDKYAVPPLPSRFALNQKVIATNYTPRTINVKVRVHTSRDIKEEISNQLIGVLDPEARKDDGAYEWEFGGRVARSRIDFEIHAVSSSITKVEIVEPASDVILSFRQLPKAGSIQVEIVKPGSV